ncbi:hypothetical protein VIN01S_30610 [Vibrio inusitatus NBRC 102082]|uniref:Uncharacterized protein n=1 Tax=Vibrio inusitatus NBRC 102082 TaxID=1219070 RepID=A0A4Y3HYR9_9VIBR|nr:tetratricopeptide repeat protein [Vibrio inusitatus]GEA52257.1 hypothetical protein VIN01S_30610 [Vibrio inusitatus NBRC 102082]
MKTQLLATIIASLLSFSVLANEQPPTHFTPNQNDPAYIAQDKAQTIQERVTALESLRTVPSQNALIAIARSLKENNELIQQAAIIGSHGLAINYRWELVSPFLGSAKPLLSQAAAYSLVKGYPQLTTPMKSELNKYIPDLEQHYLTREDTFSQFKLAEVYRLTGQIDKAIVEYNSLIETVPENQAVWVGLSESYRLKNDNENTLNTLEKGIKVNPNASQLYYAKALTLVRQGNKKQALDDIKSAAILAETNSYYWYLYAVIQKGFDLEKSVPLFEHAYQLSNSSEQLYALCDVYIDTDNPAAMTCMEELKPIAPESAYTELLTKFQNKIK